MKNYLKLATSAVALLMVTAIVVTFEACRKTDKILSYEDSSTITKYDGYGPTYTDISRTAPSRERMRTFYNLPAQSCWTEYGLVTIPAMMFCAFPKGNCLPTVVVVAERTNEFCNTGRLFQRCYERGNISDFFCDESYKLIFPEMDLMPNVLDSIKNGDIHLHHFYNNTDSVDFYIGLPISSDNEINSYDLNFQNVRCVFRIKSE